MTGDAPGRPLDPSAGRKTVLVGIAECLRSTDPRQTILTYGLGSCVGVSLWNRKTRAGGILHAMLPDSSLDAARARQNPYLFVDTGLELLVEEMSAGADGVLDLVVTMAGGASLLANAERFRVGPSNVEAATQVLAAHGLEARASDTGGSESRSMALSLRTGRVTVRRGGGEVGEL